MRRSKNRWTTANIVNSAVARNNQHIINAPKAPLTEQQKLLAKSQEKRSVEKEWISLNVAKWCNDHALTLETEYRFDPVRQWRADWYISGLRVICEYEGIYSTQSRHTSLNGYSADTDKYRAASMAGFILLRYTSKNYKNVLADLNRIYNSKLKTA